MPIFHVCIFQPNSPLYPDYALIDIDECVDAACMMDKASTGLTPSYY